MEKDNDIIAARDRIAPEQYLPGLTLKQSPSKKTFSIYLFGENKIYNILILFFITLQFFIFKYFYPYPDFFSDSYSYIFAAYEHLNVNIWPIGYSKFLLLFHWFTHSSLALNFFQYLFLEVAALYFYHTIVFFYPTGKNTRVVLCIFLFFNPLSLYLANYVTSDSIFIGLSMLWLSQIIWIINCPKISQIFVQAILFIIAFTFRYNAFYYPILAGIAFLISKHKNIWKLIGILLGPLLMLLFIMFSREASNKLTGTPQFPPILGGWQWGNNALYMREYIQEDSTKFPSPETTELDQIARRYYRTVPPMYRELSSYVANFFIRQPEAPLKQYMTAHYTPKNELEMVVAWGKVAPIFGQYGLYLIKRHPVSFAKYYILLNTSNYFLPPLEKLEIYNLGDDQVSPIASYWFHFHSTKITSVSKTLQGTLLFLYPSIFLFLNLYFLWGLYHFIRQKGFKKSDRLYAHSILLIIIFAVLNFCFSVFANIIVIRYQIFPMIVLLSFSMLLTDYLDCARSNKTMKIEKDKDNLVLLRQSQDLNLSQTEV